MTCTKLNDKQMHWIGFPLRCFVQVTGNLPEDTAEIPKLPTVKGHELHGGPQMLQLRCTLAAYRVRMCYAITIYPGQPWLGALTFEATVQLHITGDRHLSRPVPSSASQA